MNLRIFIPKYQKACFYENSLYFIKLLICYPVGIKSARWRNLGSVVAGKICARELASVVSHCLLLSPIVSRCVTLSLATRFYLEGLSET